MGAGVFMLSQLNISATRIEMIFSLIVFGIGLGFAAQAIASAIKFLPMEKSGIASGVINAFRQVGTCIGVALLVSILTTNVTKATINIKADAIADINKQAAITASVKTELVEKVNSLNGTSDFSQAEIEIQTAVENESKSQLSALPVNQRPEAMEKLSEEQTAIADVIKNVNSDKNSKVANAFSKTFLLSAIILLAMSICGVFTDRKQKE